MPKFNKREIRTWGEKYVQYLIDTERGDVSDKEELRHIFTEFKERDLHKKPSFSSVLYGLRRAGKASVHGNTVHFNQIVTKNNTLFDQYWAVHRDAPKEPASFPLPGNDISCTRAQARRIIEWMKQNRSKFIGSNSEIHITSDCDLTDGRIRLKLPLNDPKSFSIRIENRSNADVTFIQYKLLRRMRIFSFKDDLNVSTSNKIILKPGGTYEITVHCSTTYYGYFPVILVFEFESENNAQPGPFLIGRFLSAVCNSKLSDELGASTPYVPYQRNLTKQTVRNEDEGVPPDNFLSYELEQELKLDNFTPSDILKHYIKAGVFSTTGQRTGYAASLPERNLLFSKLQFNNYDKKFNQLLHLEEIQMEIDIRRYDKTKEEMRRDPKNKNLLILEVPGVAENRPSVLRGDHLFVSLSEEQQSPNVISYKGYVHAVELESVKLGFSQNLIRRFIDGMKFDVVFTFNRLPLKVQHRAVVLAKEKNIQEFIFPTFSHGHTISNTERLSLYDRSLEHNEEQKNAVKQIVSGTSRPAPYLIFGPPGTGKTVTMVESIKQVLKCIPDARVLTCAPSNSACDLLCQRLMKHVDRGQIYRLLASSRNYRDVPEEIKPCGNWDDRNGCYVYPRKLVLMNYRVIITTLVTAGRLVSAKFPNGHFTHVFIDESGHAVEPECVTAIAGILDVMNPNYNVNGGQLVLAGDPKQLGPVLRSPIAIENGLGMSLLERLMTENSLYQKGSDGYNFQFVTKLLNNYRSHPSILKIPNELFYDNELQSCADELLSNSYCRWEKLPHKGCPIIFHGILGRDEREGNSPSFFNIDEVEVIICYLTDLLQTQGKKGLAKISPKDIGIISPYRKQVEKIRKAINLTHKSVHEIKDLKVGSVEEFQGQERKVILISTVRSSEDYVKFDEDFNLGFLKNPKRFNVAITRAKALLILVGNPIILRNDPNWSKFLTYCQEIGAYTGYPIEDLEDMMNEEEIAKLLSGLKINRPPAGESTGESFVQQQAEPGWRSEE
ncbi:helicase MOV-10 [Pelobates fuscus]|uniref:helicase MOV-10 n=1 Tax=Pelobates fuscus TaxID=191477 RepID=UPI002FE468F7